MNVLIVCEESQRVCCAFRERGYNAFSADIQECSGGHPEWHIHGDGLPYLNGNCEFTTQNGEKHKIDGKWDLIIAHPPCFVAGTKVMTYDGVKSIEDVHVGDLVLTHLGRYRKVTNVMSHVAPSVVEVHAENCGKVCCTPNHPFYVQQVTAKIIDGHSVRTPQGFEWVSPENFINDKAEKGRNPSKVKTYLTSVADDIKQLPDYSGTYINYNKYAQHWVNNLPVTTIDFWYLMGRWTGDGYYLYAHQNGNKRLAGINICVNRKQTEYLAERIKKAGFTYYLEHKRTVDNFQISNKELALFVINNFGQGALGKKIPGFVTRLTDELANAFLEGYFESDGYTPEDANLYGFTTISSDLAYGLKYMINKYWKVTCPVRHDKQHNNVIEGRIVNTHDCYSTSFRRNRTKQTHYINLDNYILASYRKVIPINEPTMVYNLSVEEDESYTANGLVVHNCTHLSLSGARHFEKKRADGRQREAIEFFMKFIDADCPHICVENPMNIMSGEEYIKTWFPDLWEKYPLPLKNYQVVSPHWFGSKTRKKTCYWLKELPALRPTNIVKPELVTYTKKDGRVTSMSADFCRGAGSHDGKQRSKTAPGIAEAMADQWGAWVNNLIEKQKGNIK